MKRRPVTRVSLGFVRTQAAVDKDGGGDGLLWLGSRSLRITHTDRDGTGVMTGEMAGVDYGWRANERNGG